VGGTGDAIRHVPEEVRADREILLAAVTNNGEAIRYVPRRFRTDRDIVMAAVTQNRRAIRHVPHQFRKDLVQCRCKCQECSCWWVVP